MPMDSVWDLFMKNVNGKDLKHYPLFFAMMQFFWTSSSTCFVWNTAWFNSSKWSTCVDVIVSNVSFSCVAYVFIVHISFSVVPSLAFEAVVLKVHKLLFMLCVWCFRWRGKRNSHEIQHWSDLDCSDVWWLCECVRKTSLTLIAPSSLNPVSLLFQTLIAPFPERTHAGTHTRTHARTHTHTHTHTYSHTIWAPRTDGAKSGHWLNKFSEVSLDVNIVHKINLINLRYTLMISMIVTVCGYEDNKWLWKSSRFKWAV